MNIVDFLLVILIAVVAVISAKKGFLMSLFNIIAYIAAGFLAKIFSSPVASYVYSAYLSDKVLSKLNELMPSGSMEGELQSIIEGVFDSLPGFLGTLVDHLDIVDEVLLGLDLTGSGQTLTVAVIEADYLAPMILKVISAIAVVVLFILFSVVLRMVLSLINKGLTSKKHKLFRRTNAFLGAALGVVKGIIPAGLICAVLNIAVPALGNEKLLEFVSGSYFCGLIADILK